MFHVVMLTPEQLQELRSTPVGPTGNRVGKARELLGLKQSELAALAKLSQPYVSDVDRGRFETVTVENAHKFAAAFGCSIEDLFPASSVAA